MSRTRRAEPDDPRAIRTTRPLPLMATVSAAPRGWLIRLPLAAERVTVEKQPLVYEEVLVRSVRREEVARVRETARREVPRLERSGRVDLDAPDRDEERPR
jgi:stress response protein YsnF